MNRAPIRVLCLDIEGGYGGSSRSLFESLRHIDREEIAVEVWCRRDGPIRSRYEENGISCRIAAGMPHMNSLPRLSRNLFGYSVMLQEFVWQNRMRAELLQTVIERSDLVHFNHEGLFFLANWLRRRHRKPQTMHVRTMISENMVGRWQARSILASSDRLVFITENEKRNLEKLAGRKARGEIIYNIAMPPRVAPAACPAIAHDGRLKIAVLSNFAWVRGTDRTVEIAEVLAAKGRRDMVFVVAGDMQLRGSLPGELRRFTGRSLADYAAARGVGDMFTFLGHIAEPESALAACDLLLKPTRENNPWGRDILEALAAGKPVISIGTYDRFVETGETGFLLGSYDPAAIADIVLRLDSNRGMIQVIGNKAKKRITEYCDGPARARDLAVLWRNLVEVHRDRAAA